MKSLLILTAVIGVSTGANAYESAKAAKPAATTATTATTTTSTTATTTTATTAATTATGDIVETAVAAGSFKTLATALEAAGLVDTLKGTGPFTVFAPTDAAFAKLPKGTLEALLKAENKAKLNKVLTYHVVAGSVMAKDVKAGGTKTVEGSNLNISTAGGVRLNKTAKVTMPDITATNGVIHVIDTVVLPPGFKL